MQKDNFQRAEGMHAHPFFVNTSFINQSLSETVSVITPMLSVDICCKCNKTLHGNMCSFYQFVLDLHIPRARWKGNYFLIFHYSNMHSYLKVGYILLVTENLKVNFAALFVQSHSFS